jgi:hypothetical protein
LEDFVPALGAGDGVLSEMIDKGLANEFALVKIVFHSQDFHAYLE